jgi:hypothetical protein
VHVTHNPSESAVADRAIMLEHGRVVPVAEQVSSHSTPHPTPAPRKQGGPLFVLRNVGHEYSRRTPWAHRALSGIDLRIDDGEAVPGLLTAQSSGYDLARRETAVLTVNGLTRTANAIEAKVEVRNLAGHNLPSGVAFRRAFITFEALDANGNVVWASGRTNSVGAILKGTSDEILPTEFFYDPASRKQVWQPHYETISNDGQVQIYEEIIADSQGKITTSFVGLDKVLKSNRLLPKGWRTTGPFAEYTRPHGDAEHDPEYINNNGATGADKITYSIPLTDRTRAIVSVRATLNYQAIPPYYLRDRFTIGKGAETQRLAYLTSHLTLPGTPIDSASRRSRASTAIRSASSTSSTATSR